MGTQWLRGAVAACGFLTRIPLRLDRVRDVDLGRSVGFFPFVGLALGGAYAGAGWLLHGFLAPAPAALLLVVLSCFATGGLHLDGLADVFDGLGHAGGDAARLLAIMRDSRIGAHGAAALALLLAGKLVALAALLESGRYLMVAAAPAIARGCVVPFIIAYPYARDAGLGRAFHQTSGLREGALAGLGAAGVLVWAGWSALGPAAAALLVGGALAEWMRRRLGGLTGDVYGAIIELAEVTFLIGASVR